MTVISRRRHRIIFSLVLASIAANAHAAEPLEFSLPPYDDLILLPVEVAGKERLFALDSGAFRVCVHESLREHLGKPLEQYRVKAFDGRRVMMDSFRPPLMRIGKKDWTCSEKIICCDLTPIQKATGRNVEGVLGVPFFAAHIVQLDFDRRSVRVLPPETPPAPDWGTAVSLEFTKAQCPLVPLELPGVGTELCRLDTGMKGALAFNWGTCFELERRGYYVRQSDALTASVSGIHSIPRGRVSKVGLQNFEHADLAVYSSKGPSCVGLKYLKRFRVTIDVGNQFAYFAKGKSFDEPEQRAMGFGGSREGDKTIIVGLQRESPGEPAGLKDGDELISMDGKPVRGMANAEIAWKIRQLSQKGTKRVRLTVRRDGETRDVQLDLSEIYE